MESIARSVTEFVTPLEPSGSLDASLSFRLDEDAMAQGARLHAKLQKRLMREIPETRSEVPVQFPLEHEDFACLVRGRMDVLIPGAPCVIEEIKTTNQPGALLRALGLDDRHVYAQQARMYAWIHWRQTSETPFCRLRVVSLLDEKETLVPLSFDPLLFSRWVEDQLRALRAEHLRALARAQERRALGRVLVFPFETLRPGQERLMALVDQALESARPLLVQAPTGLGKTAAILFPALKRSLEENLRLFYVTPRNSQQIVAETFIRRLRLQGHAVRSITLRAKERVCPQEEVHCHPDACPRALGYYDRLKASGALEALAELGCADPAALKEMADRHLLCPFELSLDAARNVDVVIGDYNYALSPNATLQRFFATPEQSERNIVLVDEGHNLAFRAMDWFSPSLEIDQLRTLLRSRKTPGLARQIGRCLRLLEGFTGDHRKLFLDADLFLAEEMRIRKLVAKAAEGVALVPSHPLVQLYRMWSEFCSVLRGMNAAHIVTWIPPGRLQITCADASPHLAERWKGLSNVVLFSGTLKPFEFHERLVGLPVGKAIREEVPSPFPHEHRQTLVVPQISTRFRRRDREIPRIAQFISRVLPLHRGNYFVFFPSFDLLEKTLPLLDLPDFRVLTQPRRASPAELDNILETLREERGVVVLAVQGGSLSEGIDLPGEAMEGCIVVGPPLPPFDLERQLVKSYFDARDGAGEQYAYTYPAMARAVQAAGRVIRSAEDRGLIVFLDDRFLEETYAQCFPKDWFRDSVRESVSTSLLADIGRFWEGEPTKNLGRDERP